MTKQEFLNNFVQKEKPKDTTSAMPFLMESIKEAKRNGIEFTKEEVYSMCTELSKNLYVLLMSVKFLLRRII